MIQKRLKIFAYNQSDKSGQSELSEQVKHDPLFQANPPELFEQIKPGPSFRANPRPQTPHEDLNNHLKTIYGSDIENNITDSNRWKTFLNICYNFINNIKGLTYNNISLDYSIDDSLQLKTNYTDCLNKIDNYNNEIKNNFIQQINNELSSDINTNILMRDIYIFSQHAEDSNSKKMFTNIYNIFTSDLNILNNKILIIKQNYKNKLDKLTNEINIINNYYSHLSQIKTSYLNYILTLRGQEFGNELNKSAINSNNAKKLSLDSEEYIQPYYNALQEYIDKYNNLVQETNEKISIINTKYNIKMKLIKQLKNDINNIDTRRLRNIFINAANIIYNNILNTDDTTSPSTPQQSINELFNNIYDQIYTSVAKEYSIKDNLNLLRIFIHGGNYITISLKSVTNKNADDTTNKIQHDFYLHCSIFANKYNANNRHGHPLRLFEATELVKQFKNTFAPYCDNLDTSTLLNANVLSLMLYNYYHNQIEQNAKYMEVFAQIYLYLSNIKALLSDHEAKPREINNAINNLRRFCKNNYDIKVVTYDLQSK